MSQIALRSVTVVASLITIAELVRRVVAADP
jgi:hypothetical protein